MNAEDNLIKKYIDKGIRYGDELIVFKQFCDEFISSSNFAGLAIVGIDGFYLYADGSVQPNLDEIADFSEINADSWHEYLEQCLSAARKFIGYMIDNGKSDGYCFTLVSAEEY